MISEPAPSQITCPKCLAVSAPEKKYCADCGASLTINADIRTLIDDQIQQTIDTKFKDQKLVELETTDAIIARITSWAKRFAFWAGVPLALFVICLAILGVQKFGDFSSKIDQAVAKITPILDQSIKQANDAEAKSGAAEKTAEAAQLKASEALESVDTVVEQTKTQLASDLNSKIQSISPRLEGFEKTAAEIEETSAVVLKQVGEVKEQLAAASETITAQEKKSLIRANW